MKVAVLSDIHANFPALCAAVGNAENRGTQRFLVAGDLIGRGPNPVEVIRFLNERSYPAITGNMERKLLPFKKRKKSKKAALSKSHFAWTAQRMGKAEWEYLASLPTDLMLDIEGFTLLVVHGSPLSDKDSIYPSVTREGLRSKIGEQHPDLLICGHSHIPFVKKISGIFVVNSGAVGVSIDGDPRGSYAIIELRKDASPRARIVRFWYDYGNVASDVERRNVPGVNTEQFLRGI
jgi:putative phosphoesterase